MKHFWLRMSRTAVESEREQCRSEGREMNQVMTWFDQVLSTDLDKRGNWPPAQNLLDQTVSLPLEPDFKYHEPSAFKDIVAARPWDVPAPTLPPLDKSDIGKLTDKVYGAWTGRCVGCLLGLPFEGWQRARLWGLLKDCEQYPLSGYFRYDCLKDKTDLQVKYELGNVDKDHPFVDQIGPGGMPEDDDLNYTVMNLAILRRFGPNFTPHDVAEYWMENIPVMHTQAAESLAYRNFLLQIPPPESATYRNPYREWNGAAIRGDFWGYVAAGSPDMAGELAYRDACVSHVRNGIYAAMWVAAMTAAAFVTDDMDAILDSGLAQIPQDCRLREAVNQVREWRTSGLDYDQAVNQLYSRWEERHVWETRHAVSNAQVITLGLLYGEKDFAQSICRTVQAGFETDSNGGTVGSILGIIHGRKAIPDEWTAPIHDTLRTGVENVQTVALPHLASATLQCMAMVLGKA